MLHRKALQLTKVLNAIPPGVIKDDAAFVSNVIDTQNMAYGEFQALLGALDAAAAVFKVMESDTKTDGTTLGGTPSEVVDVTTKPGATDDGGVFVVGLDFIKNVRKRYIQLQVTAGNGAAGTYLAASFVGFASGEATSTLASRGVTGVEYS